MRREWIEIDWRMVLPEETGSPSMRREWIEMTESSFPAPAQVRSPSMRREWIEMQVVKSSWLSRIVSLHAEGVD